MKPRDRVFAALEHRTPDRVPKFEIWIDPFFGDPEEKEPHAVYAEMGQDAIMIPGYTAKGSNSWQEGIDEWGQVFRFLVLHVAHLDDVVERRHHVLGEPAVGSETDEMSIGT